MELLKIVKGKIFWASGDRPSKKKGVSSLSGKKGKAMAIQISAFESAPPNPPA
jgi:hypothetical protein